MQKFINELEKQINLANNELGNLKAYLALNKEKIDMNLGNEIKEIINELKWKLDDTERILNETE